MNQFWTWARNSDSGDRVLYLDGVIAEESWFDDDITPGEFRAELFSGAGAVTIWINSPGGDCVAASQIYAMLMDYPGPVTVKVEGIAASAASVISMAGTQVLMAPTALMMIHNPLTLAIGDSEEMRKAIAMLDEYKESIVNAYEIKTGLPRSTISQLMDAETWLSAHKAVELGFADGLLFQEGAVAQNRAVAFAYSPGAVNNHILAKLPKARRAENKQPANAAKAMPIAWLDKRLSLLQ